MMTTIGGIYFAFCAIACLVGALITVLARNPIRGAIGLLTTVVGIAGLFLLLRAQFLAAIQIIVYAGAVVVLFVFVILLLGADAIDSTGAGKSKLTRLVGGGGLFALATAALFLLGPELSELPLRFAKAPETHGSVADVGTLLFTQGLVPFELATALLIVAVVGAIAMARARAVSTVVAPQSDATRRLFHGPIHPRDAGYPLPKGGDR